MVEGGFGVDDAGVGKDYVCWVCWFWDDVVGGYVWVGFGWAWVGPVFVFWVDGGEDGVEDVPELVVVVVVGVVGDDDDVDVF